MADPLFNVQHQTLLSVYGVRFPEDFLHFWKFMNEVDPEDPYTLPMEFRLVGAFEILGGLLESTVSSYPLRMHWRFYKDPPELFTVIDGGIDGLHFGYYYDDPCELPTCMGGYYHHDAYQFDILGRTIFELLQHCIEKEIAHFPEWIEEGQFTPEEGAEEMAELHQFLQQMQNYCSRHAIPSPPERRITANTWDEMGIVVPPETYRPLTDHTKAGKLVEAQTALREGFPGTALKLAKDLWTLHDPEWEPHAIALMESAYTALNRPILAEILREHLNTREPLLAYLDLGRPLLAEPVER